MKKITTLKIKITKNTKFNFSAKTNLSISLENHKIKVDIYLYTILIDGQL